MRTWFDDCLAGAEGPRGENFNMRWIASMVAEAHRILVRGGVYLYPGDAREGYRNGRLRLLYEANPIALLMEQAGGRASTGRERILDRVPRLLHERVPLDFRRARGGGANRAISLGASLRRTKLHRLFARRGLFVCRASLSRGGRVGQASHHLGHRLVGRRHHSVRRTFEQIFRREGITAAFIEGDAFHRYDRAEHESGDGRRDGQGQRQFQPLRRQRESARGARGPVLRIRRAGTGRTRHYVHDTVELESYGQPAGTFTPWEDLPRTPNCCSTRGCTAPS